MIIAQSQFPYFGKVYLIKTYHQKFNFLSIVAIPLFREGLSNKPIKRKEVESEMKVAIPLFREGLSNTTLALKMRARAGLSRNSLISGRSI